MNILIVSATHNEIAPLIATLEKRKNPAYLYNNPYVYYLRFLNTEVDIIIAGIGITSTTYHLTKLLALQDRKYNFVINAGIAGSFTKELKLGEVVEVVTDCFSDLGIEDGETFIPLFNSGLSSPTPPFNNNGEVSPACFINKHIPLQKVKGITVNTVHGNEVTIEKVKKQLNPDIESMEGAAFFYCCLSENIPCIQIRAISNYVEKRNKENWEINLAIRNLNEILIQFFEERNKL